MSRWRTCLCTLAIVVAPSLPRAQEPVKAPAFPHRLTGAELEAHFKGNWTTNAMTSRASMVTVYNNSDETLGLQQHNSGRASIALATRTVKVDEERVCLDFGTSI